jgi:hypothetical protein
MATSCSLWVKKWSIFFNKTLQRHIGSYLSGLDYSKLVLGQFEKLTIFLVDPLSLTENKGTARAQVPLSALAASNTAKPVLHEKRVTPTPPPAGCWHPWSHFPWGPCTRHPWPWSLRAAAAVCLYVTLRSFWNNKKEQVIIHLEQVITPQRYKFIWFGYCSTSTIKKGRRKEGGGGGHNLWVTIASSPSACQFWGHICMTGKWPVSHLRWPSGPTSFKTLDPNWGHFCISNVKCYLINYPYLWKYGQMIFCLYFPPIDRATAPGRYEQFYLNVEALTEHVPYPAKLNFEDAIRSD